MAIEIQHQEHIYTYEHPMGWVGGDEHVRAQLNASKPAGEYPPLEGEKIAVKHALAGILSGGEIVSPIGSHHRADIDESLDETSLDATNPDRILEG